ncbi:MAG TPA: hypothetical protein PKJ77_05250, partial [Thermodesulfobacteriota bacterium]|nr:hypothetical protein [Thermodesulfobacteriota bacterium]
YPDREIPLPENFRHDMNDSPYRERAARMTRYQVPENVRSGLSIYYGMVKEVDYCGIISGKDVDKSKLFTISLISSRSLTEVTGAWASSLPKPFR